jgi:hypothetical protein
MYLFLINRKQPFTVGALNRLEADVASIGIFSIGAVLMIINVEEYLTDFTVQEDIDKTSDVKSVIIMMSSSWESVFG